MDSGDCYALVIHDVADAAAWKAVFDGAADLRRDSGELEHRLLHADGDERRIVHLARWTSLDAARAFFESPEVARLRAEGGVEPPQFLYLHEFEHGTAR
jgi:heme-degrading monooxygenase HmoA